MKKEETKDLTIKAPTVLEIIVGTFIGVMAYDIVKAIANFLIMN